MPARGKIRSWIFEDITGVSAGPPPSDIALDLMDDVKLWALLYNGQLEANALSAVGLQVAFEV
jgi:hypothetical protein